MEIYDSKFCRCQSDVNFDATQLRIKFTRVPGEKNLEGVESASAKNWSAALAMWREWKCIDF